MGYEKNCRVGHENTNTHENACVCVYFCMCVCAWVWRSKIGANQGSKSAVNPCLLPDAHAILPYLCAAGGVTKPTASVLETTSPFSVGRRKLESPCATWKGRTLYPQRRAHAVGGCEASRSRWPQQITKGHADQEADDQVQGAAGGGCADVSCQSFQGRQDWAIDPLADC